MREIGITVKPTLSCNMRCKHCFNGEKMRQSGVIPVERVILLLQKASIEYDILTSYNSIYIVDDIEELQGLINYIIDDFGNEVNLNWIDVSNVDNMANLFKDSDFNGDISKWDVSNVRNMQGMFKFCPF